LALLCTSLNCLCAAVVSGGIAGHMTPSSAASISPPHPIRLSARDVLTPETRLQIELINRQIEQLAGRFECQPRRMAMALPMPLP
jgi:hypothetical protein